MLIFILLLLSSELQMGKTSEHLNKAFCFGYGGILDTKYTFKLLSFQSSGSETKPLSIGIRKAIHIV